MMNRRTSILIHSQNLVPCTATYQCYLADISDAVTFVTCVNGFCACLTQNGIEGNATTAFRCNCPPPSEVYYQSNSPYCITYQDAVSWKLDRAQQNHQNAIVSQIYADLIWPTPSSIMENLIAGLPTALGKNIAPNGVGRVDPLGAFYTHDGVVEYFYGAAWTGAVRCSNTSFIYLFSRGSMTYMSVDISLSIYDHAQQNVLFSYVLRQSGTFRFNADGLVESLHLIIHNLGPNSNWQSPPGSQSQIDMFCSLIMDVAHCNSTNDTLGAYQNIAECQHYFTNVYRWGTWDDLYFNGNTSICRFYHTLLAIGRPSVHCSHAGKSGGGKCIDHVYETYFDHNF